MRRIQAIVTLQMAVLSLCFGQWELIDDFQHWEPDQIFTEVTDIGWHGYSPDGTDEYWLLSVPEDPSNIVLYVESGNYGIGYGNVWIQKALPEGGIAPGETGTLFLRSFWTGFVNKWSVGTADKEIEYDPFTGMQVAPGAWGDFNALIRLGNDRELQHRDGDGYVKTDPPTEIEVNQWYNFWMVMENTWDMSTSPPTSTGVYALYMQGPGIGDGESPTLIPVGTDPAKDKASFRRAPVDADGNPQAIIWAQFATDSAASISRPSEGDPFLLDDFYFSKGSNLTNPVKKNPWGYPWVNAAKDIDTGNWLGWINAWHDPFIWLYATNNWLYMEEPDPDAQGAWGYFYK